MKYYIVETSYTGPNQQDHLNDDTIEIRTSPAVNNQSQEPCIEGWCGSTEDWTVHAYGEYDTLLDAQCAILNAFDPVRFADQDYDLSGNIGQNFTDDTKEIYRKGKFPLLSKADTVEYYYDSVQGDIQVDMTDDQIAEWVKICKSEILDFIPDWEHLEEMAINRRDKLALFI